MRFKVTACDKDKKANTLEVKVVYDKGGMNYFTYQPVKRGYFLSIQPLNVGDHTVSFVAFSGARLFLEETKRLNSKKLEAMNTPENIHKLVDLHGVAGWARREGYTVDFEY